jgi:hypothetical protein
MRLIITNSRSPCNLYLIRHKCHSLGDLRPSDDHSIVLPTANKRCKRGTSKSRSDNGNHNDDITAYMIDGETIGFVAEPDQDPSLNVQHMNGAEDQA